MSNRHLQQLKEMVLSEVNWLRHEERGLYVAIRIVRKDFWSNFLQIMIKDDTLEERRQARDRIVERMKSSMATEEFAKWHERFMPQMNSAYGLQDHPE